jgi:DNA-methyltransferase (dcm)
MNQELKTNNSIELPPVIFSFFSGCGFLDLGFENEGFEIALVNELSPSFLAAYKFSRSKMGIAEPRFGYFNLDINDFLNERNEELRRLVNEIRSRNRLVGFIGGPPCPDFSVGGKNKGRDGLNGRLSLAYVDLIIDIIPDFFLFENVKGLWSTARHRTFFQELKTKIHNAGYATTERLCNALEFAVPQDRERVLFFGVKSDLLAKEKQTNCKIIDFPWEKFTKYKVENVKNMEWSTTNAFGADVPPPLDERLRKLTVKYWFEKNDVEHHANGKAHFSPRAGIEKMKTVLEGDVSRKSYKRLHRYRYSPTAAYGNNEVHLHPYKERRLSAAEALAIQSLPKSFELPQEMTLTDMFKTIGNGVPFLLACGIAKTIKAYLDNCVCKK